MELLRPVTVNADAALARANPVAKLAAAAILLLVLFASLDGVTAAVILLGLAAAMRWSGIDPRALLRRSWLVGLAAISIGVFNILFTAEQLGTIVLQLGPIRIGAETLLIGIGLMLRLLAIALAGILATATTEPSDLADALIQQLGVSPRFAIGALAALRLVPLMARERQTIALARRARGVDSGRNLVAAVRLAGGQLVALLVGAVRRGSRMALAMEARGFGSLPSRTVARVQRMRATDWAWIAGAAALAALAVGISLALGAWRPLFG
jgi:energy-coupling factor transport system permease protein